MDDEFLPRVKFPLGLIKTAEGLLDDAKWLAVWSAFGTSIFLLLRILYGALQKLRSDKHRRTASIVGWKGPLQAGLILASVIYLLDWYNRRSPKGDS